VLNTPEAVRGITYWTELYTKHKVVPEGTLNYNISRDLVPLFNNSQIAMLAFNIDGIQIFSQNPEMSFGIVQMPGGKYSRVVGWSLTVPVNAPHKQGALDYLMWYSQAAVQAKHSVVEPANIAAWELGPPWTGDDYKQLRKSGDSLKSLPTADVWADAEKIIVSELQLIMEGRKTPQQGADAMTAQINALIK
jgi:multiple sugar transport system substrate-binding protein